MTLREQLQKLIEDQRDQIKKYIELEYASKLVGNEKAELYYTGRICGAGSLLCDLVNLMKQ